MRLYTGNKNSPFALDVALDERNLSFSVHAVMQREFVGDPAMSHSNGGRFFDQSLITEWRGNFGVFGQPIYERTLNLDSLREHPEFSDHASFMLYAPVGFMDRSGTSAGFFQQTPNLYAATLASKMDAQAYHASVLQTHPIGHVLVPFKTSPIADWSIGFNVFDPELIKVSSNIEVIPAVTLALVREETLPVVRFVGGPSINVSASGEVSIDFQLEIPDGDPIEDRDAEVYLESTAGYLVARRVRTSGGSGCTVFRPDGMATGDVAKIKVGFKYFSGTDDLLVNVQ
jgi:hypothetical protein